MSDLVLLQVRLLKWKWLLYHLFQNSHISILQQMRWSIPYLICNLKSGVCLHLKIVNPKYLKTFRMYSVSFISISFIIYIWTSILNYCRGGGNFADRSLVYGRSCHQGIWSWLEGTRDPYRFVSTYWLCAVPWGWKVDKQKMGDSKWHHEDIGILFCGFLCYKLDILIL